MQRIIDDALTHDEEHLLSAVLTGKACVAPARPLGSSSCFSRNSLNL
jgi:hypothetical protein